MYRKDWSVCKNVLRIFHVPNRNRKNGITIRFTRDKNDKRNKETYPIMTTDIHKGQELYELPNGFNSDNIVEIKLLY